MWTFFKLRSWIRKYVNPRIKDGWKISRVYYAIAERVGSLRKVYVVINNIEDGSQTSGDLCFRHGVLIRDETRDVWQKESIEKLKRCHEDNYYNLVAGLAVTDRHIDDLNAYMHKTRKMFGMLLNVLDLEYTETESEAISMIVKKKSKRGRPKK